MKKKILLMLSITLLSINLIACSNTTNSNNGNSGEPNATQTQSTPNKNVKNEDLSTDEIDKDDSLTVEQKYEKAVAQINMEEYLTPTYDNIIPISPNDALEKMQNGETFILFHGRTDCRFCKYVYPSIDEVAPDGLKVYYVNTDYFRYLYPTKSESDELGSEFFQYVKKQHDAYKETMHFEGVPNLRYIKNGNIEIELANPLSASFFEDDATAEQKEQYLQEMKNILGYYLNYMYEDMNGVTPTPTPKVTVVK